MYSQIVSQLVARAFREVAIYTPVLPVPPDDLAYGCDELNLLFDESHNDRRLTYSESIQTFVLIPNQQSFTIGPAANTPNFVVVNRPIEIRSANIIQTDVSPNVVVPLTIETWRFWADDVPVRGIGTTLPQHLYYQRDWPVGTIYLYPFPTLAYSLELWTRSSAFFNGTGTGGTWQLTDQITLPPGFAKWASLKLAKRLAPAYPGAVVPATLESSLQELESKLFNMTEDTPPLATVDAGMPSGHTASGTMNYRSRMPN